MPDTDAPVLVHYLSPEHFPGASGPLKDPALGQLLRGGYRVVASLPVTDPGGHVAGSLAMVLVQAELTTAPGVPAMLPDRPAAIPAAPPAWPVTWTPSQVAFVGFLVTAFAAVVATMLYTA